MRLFTTDKIVRESSIDSKHKTEQCEIFNSCKQIIKKHQESSTAVSLSLCNFWIFEEKFHFLQNKYSFIGANIFQSILALICSNQWVDSKLDNQWDSSMLG